MLSQLHIRRNTKNETLITTKDYYSDFWVLSFHTKLSWLGFPSKEKREDTLTWFEWSNVGPPLLWFMLNTSHSLVRHTSSGSGARSRRRGKCEPGGERAEKRQTWMETASRVKKAKLQNWPHLVKVPELPLFSFFPTLSVLLSTRSCSLAIFLMNRSLELSFVVDSSTCYCYLCHDSWRRM